MGRDAENIRILPFPMHLMRDAGAADLDAVLELNNAAVPNVNQLERVDLERIVALAAYYRLVQDAEGVAGFVICLP